MTTLDLIVFIESHTYLRAMAMIAETGSEFIYLYNEDSFYAKDPLNERDYNMRLLDNYIKRTQGV